jgi:hypothetical protein
MCLIIDKNQKPQIATEPIVCYKCLTEDMLSPCYNQKYELGKMLTSEFSIDKTGYYSDKVKKGLHSFAEESEAKCIAKDFCWCNQISGYSGIHTPVIVKCKIPTGAAYYKAESMSIGVSYEYASNQLLPLEIISK